ncbi:hypothetical protein KM914_16285 [Virgibacillus pantothenticus]|uniref:hypothetical protein n=1 Tax=Bacillaceae TaxID=186817 RepID=UPI0009857146|nr:MULTISPECIES: hypothetical protein [Bacillaceae]MBU8567958.1 hypothetical protein [Virgibacillus pantothenticus]MBU8601786.1 hypothetical protein [Virgibacillus pantothenticus]MBU8635940.1 hypothetical protein [Virgibacillus pantothenticus]MBU8643624.1 hypothetical protein [Virgibacillus pantothenticus]MBU8647764.1 hypothetical protein [Virgibacillus pantothenticus]
MIVLLALLALVLFFAITKTQFFKKGNSNNKFMTQLGMAILVGVVTINTLFTSSGTTLKYTVVGIGIVLFIAILIEMIITKKKLTTS